MRDDVRSRILDASLKLLSEGGLGALSMRAVARDAGVSHQAPYHYFQDREAIFAELVKTGFEGLRDYEVAAISSSDDPKQRALELGCAYVRFAMDNPALFQLMFRREMVELDNYPDAHAVADEAFNIPQAVIAAAHGKSEADSLPEMLACWSISHGLATLILEGKLAHRVGESREELDAAVRAAMTAFMGRMSPK